MTAEKQHGQCRCGAVRFEAAGRPLVTIACHCRGCQRMTASAFSLSSLYDADRFGVTEGEPVLGGLRGPTRHFFCSSCKSWLFTHPEGMDQLVNVRSSLFDDAAGHLPFVDVYRSEALPRAESGAAKRFDALPQPEQFGELIAAYTEWCGSTATTEEERS